MKKSVCLMAILGAFAASVNAATETVVVRFTGDVQAATCDVTVGQNGNLVHLGRVAPEANKKGSIVPVTFSFTNCKETQLKSVEFTGGQNGGLDDKATGKLGTNLANVEVKLYNNAAGNGPFTPKHDINKTFTKTDKSLVVTPYYARLETGGTAPTAGTVQSSALFEVTYQ